MLFKKRFHCIWLLLFTSPSHPFTFAVVIAFCCRWLQGLDDTQKTDVHYRSLDGEGNFNWRLVFPFEYLPQEKVMVVKKKEHFYSLDTTERRLPPRLTIQVWDNDLFNPDDFIG